MLYNDQVDLINLPIFQIIICQIVSGDLCLRINQSRMYLHIRSWYVLKALILNLLGDLKQITADFSPLNHN